MSKKIRINARRDHAWPQAWRVHVAGYERLPGVGRSS